MKANIMWGCSIIFHDPLNYQLNKERMLFKLGCPWPWLYVIIKCSQDCLMSLDSML